jgi:hypothetical protein
VFPTDFGSTVCYCNNGEILAALLDHDKPERDWRKAILEPHKLAKVAHELPPTARAFHFGVGARHTVNRIRNLIGRGRFQPPDYDIEISGLFVLYQVMYRTSAMSPRQENTTTKAPTGPTLIENIVKTFQLQSSVRFGYETREAVAFVYEVSV